MKKLNGIIKKLEQLTKGEVFGACCCRDSSGAVKDCRYSAGSVCGQSYEAFANNWICTFYENYPCNEVCFSEMPTPPSLPPSDSSPAVSPSTTPPPSAPPAPGSPGAPTAPTSPGGSLTFPTPNDCSVMRTPWADCLNRMDVGDSPTSTSAPLDKCRKRLQSIVKGWRTMRCPKVDLMCYVKTNGQWPQGYQAGPITDEIRDAYGCYCDIEQEFLEGIKNIVTRFCAQNPPMSCAEVNKALKRLCEQYNKAKLACKRKHPNVPSLIVDFGADCGI